MSIDDDAANDIVGASNRIAYVDCITIVPFPSINILALVEPARFPSVAISILPDSHIFISEYPQFIL